MFYDFALPVTAGTAQNAPTKYTLKLTAGIITHVYVEFPAGCRGYAYCTIDWQGHQLYPTNPNGAFNADDYTIPIEDRFPLLVAPYKLYAKVWAPDANYDHTITVRVEILDPDVLWAEARLPESVSKVISFLGGITPPPEEEEEVPPPPPEEEVPPPPPEEEVPPPPPEEEEPTPPPEEEEPTPPPPPPICTLGETKCEGYDLYECQEVDGEPGWVLKEKDSETCGYVPPPKPPQRGTIEEAQLEIDAKENLSAFHQGLISSFLKTITDAERKQLDEFVGFYYMPEEMAAYDLAEWKKSYYYSVPYFSFCLQYPTYTKGPLEYYCRNNSDYREVFAEKWALFLEEQSGGV